MIPIHTERDKIGGFFGWAWFGGLCVPVAAFGGLARMHAGYVVLLVGYLKGRATPKTVRAICARCQNSPALYQPCLKACSPTPIQWATLGLEAKKENVSLFGSARAVTREDQLLGGS
ncbi:hypothetical protein SLA2020_355300 [Shorea laevis]